MGDESGRRDFRAGRAGDAPGQRPRLDSCRQGAAIVEKIVKKGYTIIAHIGDQQSDSRRRLRRVRLQLPNPVLLNRLGRPPRAARRSIRAAHGLRGEPDAASPRHA